MTSLSKYYKIAAIIPSGIIILIGMILSITHDGSHYKSEWFTDDGFVLTVMLTILLSCLVSILSLTVFLTKYPAIKANAFLSVIAWTLLPGALCLFIIYEETLNFTGYSNIDGSYPGNRFLDCYIMTLAVIHLFGLVVSYMLFRIKTGTNIGQHSG